MSKTGSRPRVLAIANQKGGVGKTTTAINLGTALAAVEERVLIVDLDPQGNASTGLGIPNSYEARTPSTFEILTGESTLAEAQRPTSVSRLNIIPADIDLRAIEHESLNKKHRNYMLRDALKRGLAELDASGEVAPTYVLIDCPPSLNVLTMNAFAAADAVVVPLQCEFFAMEGLGLLVNTIEKARKDLNPSLHVQGVVLTMHDGRQVLTQQVEENVRAYLGDRVYSSTIPRNVTISEAPSHGEPVLTYDLSSKGSQAYIAFARELIKRERGVAA